MKLMIATAAAVGALALLGVAACRRRRRAGGPPEQELIVVGTDLLHFVGNTPMQELRSLSAATHCRVLVKCEQVCVGM